MALPQNLPLSEIPLREPPAGISPNFVNPQTLAPVIVAVSAVMMIWALSFVVIRLWANIHASRYLRLDDYFCIVATILALSNTGLVISLNRFARHDFDIPLIWFTGTYWKLAYAETVLIGPTLFFAKGAILLLYLRIFTINRIMRYSIWLGLLWNTLLYWSGIPIATYYCTPRIGKPWDPVTITNSCVKFTTYTLVQGVLSVVLDVYISILPIPIVLTLQISLKRRLSILGVFGTAVLGITAAVVAMVYRVYLYTSKNDSLWKGASLYICISCENYVAIIVSSMPAVASVSKENISIASWLASMRSCLTQSRIWSSRSKVNVPYNSRTVMCPSDEVVITGHHAGDGGYLELGDSRDAEDYELGSVKTEIRGTTDGQRIFEEGVVHKSVAVHQSTRQARPAV